MRSSTSVLSVRQVPNETGKWLQQKDCQREMFYLLNPEVTMLELRLNKRVELIPAVHRWLFTRSIAGPCLTPCCTISTRWSGTKVFTFLGERNWEATVRCNESWVQFPHTHASVTVSTYWKEQPHFTSLPGVPSCLLCTAVLLLEGELSAS